MLVENPQVARGELQNLSKNGSMFERNWWSTVRESTCELFHTSFDDFTFDDCF